MLNYTDGRTVKLYRALAIHSGGNNGNVSSSQQEFGSSSDCCPDQLNLKKHDAQAIYNYICRMQLTNSSCFLDGS